MSNKPSVVADKIVDPKMIVRSKSRRRFVQGVSVLVPTVLTVSARSTLAATCLSPSASASIDLLHSRPDRLGDGVCAGRSPGYWKNKKYDRAKKTRFGDIFTGGFPGKTMQQAAGLTGNGNFEALARHLAAAWCNLDSGLVTSNVLSLHDLQVMWAGRHGTYAPIVGSSVLWGQDRIVDYLKTTMS